MRHEFGVKLCNKENPIHTLILGLDSHRISEILREERNVFLAVEKLKKN